MDSLGIQEGEVIMHPMVTRSISKAQKRVEQQNFSIREHLLKYDDVMNVQREVVYSRRRGALFGDIQEEVENLLAEFIAVTLDTYCDEKERAYAWDWDGLLSSVLRTLMIDPHLTDDEKETIELDQLEQRLFEAGEKALERRRELFGDELYEKVLRYTTLKIVDREWMDHLYEMDRLKEGIGLRSYAQRDPLIEYKRDGLAAFEAMLGRVAEQSLRGIMTVQVRTSEPQPRVPSLLASAGKEIKNETGGMAYQGQAPVEAGEGGQPPQQPGGGRSMSRAARRRRGEGEGGAATKAAPVKREMPKVGRNDPCPCGSGKKYKHCHGR
jgi:preprotein translocase subunit SecA